MKRIKLSLAALAVVMVLGSAFTSPRLNGWTVLDPTPGTSPESPVFAEKETVKQLYCQGPDEILCAVNETEDDFIYREDIH